MPDAEVRAEVEGSAGPAEKVKVNKDGSYSLGVFHSGSFTLTAGYTGEGGNYQSSDPKPFNDIKAKNMNGQDIALKYGHTITLNGSVSLYGMEGGRIKSKEFSGGVTVIIEVEGVEVARTTTSKERINLGGYTLHNVAHNGRLVIKINHTGYEPYSYVLNTTSKTSYRSISVYGLE